MWHFKSKCQRIEILVKANNKRLKIVFISGVKNFGPTSIASKLIEFSHFDDFFYDLAKFQDLNVFLLFDFLDLDNFPDFLACSITFSQTPTPLIS